MKTAFTKAEGIALQLKNLAEWKPRLSLAAYAALETACHESNAALPPDATGFDVMRGCDLDRFLVNWYPAPVSTEAPPPALMTTPDRDTADFLEAVLWAYPEDDNGEQEHAGRKVYEFSPEFITAASGFIAGFRQYLASLDIEIPDSARSFGGNVYFSLSGHGCGFSDDFDTEHLQAALEAFSGDKYRFEGIDLLDGENGKLDLAFIPEARGKYLAKMFTPNHVKP